MTIVSLLTDFGLDDTYVGQLKGAILAVAQHAILVDLTHAVAAQDVAGGAFQLWSAVEPFPAGAIHVAVVDPGVGSNRRAIALRAARGDIFVGPDNGLLMPAVERLGGAVEAVELNQAAFWRPNPSATFHARDVFGPVAGHLASGVRLARVGRPIDAPLRPFRLPRPEGQSGQVVQVDRYGNLITNLSSAELPPNFQVRIVGYVVPRAAQYAAVDVGALLAVVGSAGLLEVSARNASAATITGASRGTPVRVEALP